MRGFNSRGGFRSFDTRQLAGHGWWWTPERDDLAKALRVLGLPPGNGGWVIRRWNKIKRERGDFA